MEAFKQYLQHFDRCVLWTSREWSETLTTVYVMLRVCAREGCDTLTAHPGGFILARSGQQVDRFPDIRDADRIKPNFRELLRIVRNRDALVRDRVRLVAEGPDGAVYRLAQPGEPPLDPAAAERDRRDAEEAPVALLYGPPLSRAREPRAAWGLRDRPVPPYDLAALRRAGEREGRPLVHDGVARGIMWIARAQPALSVGLAEALAESVTSGWPPDELLERAQVRLEGAQAFVDDRPDALGAPLRLHHREPGTPGSGRWFAYLTGRGLEEGDYLLIYGEVYDALVGEHDRLLGVMAVNEYAHPHAEVLVVRDGTVMAIITPAFTGPSQGVYDLPQLRDSENPVDSQ